MKYTISYIYILTGYSSETGYEWDILSSSEMGPEITKSASVTYPCHRSVKVLQAVAMCGGSTVRANRVKVDF